MRPKTMRPTKIVSSKRRGNCRGFLFFVRHERIVRPCNHPAAEYPTSPRRRRTNSPDGAAVSSRPSPPTLAPNCRWKPSAAAPDLPHPANSSPVANCWIVTRDASGRRVTRPSFPFPICWNVTLCGWPKSANVNDPPAATSCCPLRPSPATRCSASSTSKRTRMPDGIV